ncbi:MAG: magnesium transporter [Proteobacteria bacterium]|nr:magnesium transporter [Pseudomonadota bacterium]MBS0572546.1 magnesium transporter [Pseudomonadota bacterium]
MAGQDEQLNERREPAEDEDYGLDPRTVEAILQAADAGDAAGIDALMEPLHPADIADLLEQIGAGERAKLLSHWSRGIDGDILSELDESIREEVIEALPHEVLSEAVRELDSDDVVDIVEDLEEPQQERILGALDDSERAAVKQSLTYPDRSAGRLMQREFVTAPEDWTVGAAIDFLRGEEELPDQFYHVILVDPRWHPVGYVTLGKLLSSRRAVRLKDITEDSFRTISVTEDEGEVAYAFNQYHLISAPVVDEHDRLVGVITIDDAMIVLDEEHEEDVLRLAGVAGESSISDGVVETCRRRTPWLAVNLLTAILASWVISLFSNSIQAIVALATLMPIVASQGGNAATQTLAVAVRGLATKDLTPSNAGRIVLRELMVGGLNGLIFALVMGATTVFWFGSPLLALVMAMAMIINLLAAALGGILIPLAIERLGFDPALASGAFVTTVTDVVGFFSFLGLATLILIGH